MADYVAVSAVKDEMDISGTDYDNMLTGIVTRASRAVDTYCGREEDAFAASESATRYFPGSDTDEVWIDEAVSISAVSISDDDGDSYTALAATDYDTLDGIDYDKTPIRLLRMNPNGDYARFYAGRKAVKVTGVWGYSSVAPRDVEQATLIVAGRLFKRALAGFTDSTANPELGEQRYTRAMDPEAQMWLEPYRRLTVG